MDCVVASGLHFSCRLARVPEKTGCPGAGKCTVISWDVMSAEAAGTVVLFSLIHTVVILMLPQLDTEEGALVVLGRLGDRCPLCPWWPAASRRTLQGYLWCLENLQ